jgi:hypothetical protein
VKLGDAGGENNGAAALGCLGASCMVNQDAAHHLGSDAEEVGTARRSFKTPRTTS